MSDMITATKNNIRRGLILIDDNDGSKYLVVKVNKEKNSVICLDQGFNFVSIGIDFLKHYHFDEEDEVDVNSVLKYLSNYPKA